VLLASALTFVETARTLQRDELTGRLSRARLQSASDSLREVEEATRMLPLGPGLLERARRAFPHEPVRALDAIHLATALEWQRELGAIVLATTDAIMRRNAAALGFRLLPSS
jgi:predicted nucleic acid-binding protein